MSEWISVEERLPEALGKHGYTKDVLVTVAHCNNLEMPMTKVDRYDHLSKTWLEHFSEHGWVVSYWKEMPLPAPPSPTAQGEAALRRMQEEK